MGVAPKRRMKRAARTAIVDMLRARQEAGLVLELKCPSVNVARTLSIVRWHNGLSPFA
jgi:hypothetical protein